MKFEKITENKIHIIFDIEDLNKENINFHSFMANSDETKKLFNKLLNEAEKEIGFITKNHTIIVEALVNLEGKFVLTVTKATPKTETISNKTLIAKKKKSDISNTCTIFKFSSFDDICNLFDFLTTEDIEFINNLFTKTALYVYNSQYYICLTLSSDNVNKSHFKKVFLKISEFGCFIKNSNLFEKHLIEYGNIVIENNVFNKIKKDSK